MVEHQCGVRNMLMLRLLLVDVDESAGLCDLLESFGLPTISDFFVQTPTPFAAKVSPVLRVVSLLEMAYMICF